jgi:hypothetical protein
VNVQVGAAGAPQQALFSKANVTDFLSAPLNIPFTSAVGSAVCTWTAATLTLTAVPPTSAELAASNCIAPSVQPVVMPYPGAPITTRGLPPYAVPIPLPPASGTRPTWPAGTMAPTIGPYATGEFIGGPFSAPYYPTPMGVGPSSIIPLPPLVSCAPTGPAGSTCCPSPAGTGVNMGCGCTSAATAGLSAGATAGLSSSAAVISPATAGSATLARSASEGFPSSPLPGTAAAESIPRMLSADGIGIDLATGAVKLQLVPPRGATLDAEMYLTYTSKQNNYGENGRGFVNVYNAKVSQIDTSAVELRTGAGDSLRYTNRDTGTGLYKAPSGERVIPTTVKLSLKAA